MVITSSSVAPCPECGGVHHERRGEPHAWENIFECRDCGATEAESDFEQRRAASNRGAEKRAIPGMRGRGWYCEGTRRIGALPATHLDAYPESEADALRKMRANGIDPETGSFTDDAARQRAIAEGRRHRRRRGGGEYS